MPQINVEISAEAEVTVEVGCMKGAGCEQLTRALRDAIGQTTENRKKPEFYQANAAGQGATQKQ